MPPIIRADLDEMLFETREKRYGAFWLRKHYGLHLLVATAVVAVGFAALTGYSARVNRKNVVKAKRAIATEISLENLPPPPKDESEPPPPPPELKAPPPQLKTVAFKIPEPTAKENLREEEEIVSQEALKEAPNIGLKDIEGSTDGPIPIVSEQAPPPVIERAKEDEPDINEFILDAEEPKPINIEDIKAAIGYPDVAREANIEGIVVVRVLVDKQGNYKTHKVIKKVHPVLADAVEQQIINLKFTPAVQGGRTIPFWVNVPFNFKLVR